jgi:enediyne polyketide synthase
VSDAIAIIGMACTYPDADDPGRLWENALSRRRAFRRIPPERLNLDDYYSPDRRTPDAIYAQHAALIEDYQFDRVRFRVSGSTYRSTDLTHWLALDVADRTLADAGFDDLTEVSRDRVGLVVGNTLTGEFSRSGLLRLRWPYVRRTLGAALARRGWSDDDLAGLLAELEHEYKAPFPPITEDSLAGGLSNTIAGRICNTYDFHGGGYAVDGACSSSLLAVINAATALARNELDLALAGGVDLSIDPFELVGFAKTGALAADLMRVYDARSEGFWPGEGCGFLALARLDDAITWDARIHAVLRGWGVSSDGSGGLTRPEMSGHLLAMRRAYGLAGFGPDTVAYFEGHGTGTAVGDATELATIKAARREAGADPSRPAAIGSIKANIGHTKAAAGVAGLIKAVQAVRHQVIPPITGCDDPHPELADGLRGPCEPEVWPADRALRAGVSAMGFGGINTHVVVESSAPGRRSRLSARHRALAATYQDHELIPFAAADGHELTHQIAELAEQAARLGFGDLRDLAITRSAATDGSAPARAAVLAATPAQLAQRLDELRALLHGGASRIIDPAHGIFAGTTASAPRIGFLFPGQAAPTYLTAGALGVRFPDIAELVGATEPPAGTDLRDTAVAQPAIVLAELAGLAVMQHLGIEATVATGHSVGELAALHWAGALDRDAVLRLARVRGRAMADLPGDAGAMAEISAAEDVVTGLVTGLPVNIAVYNAPDRLVVSGPSQAVTAAVNRARSRKIVARRLPVSHAFHSPVVAPAADDLRRYLAAAALRPLAGRVVSTVSGAPLAPDTDLRDHLCRQIPAPVRFDAALSAVAAETNLLIEVGPGEVLAGIARGQEQVIALDACGSSLRGVLAAAGAAYAVGAPVRLAALAEGRIGTSSDPLRARTYLANPCESAPDRPGAVVGRTSPEPASAPAPSEIGPADAAPLPAGPTDERAGAEEDAASDEDALTVVRRVLARVAELPVEVVTGEARMLSELRLNSITIAQIAVEAAAVLGVRGPAVPTEIADVTVADLAELLVNQEPSDGFDALGQAPGIGNWLRPFEVVWEPTAVPLSPAALTWRLAAHPDHPLREAVRAAFDTVPDDGAGDGSGDGDGLVVLVPAGRTAESAAEMLEALRPAARLPQGHRIAVIHDGNAGGLVRTLAWERPDLHISLIEPGHDAESLRVARAVAEGLRGFAERRVLPTGEVYGPALRLLDGEPDEQAAPLGRDDVLLVTGGGKGIGAECALTIAAGSGASVAVLGRSDPDTDPDLAENLARLSAACGERFRYLRADVCDPSAIETAVKEVRTSFGPVTAVVHAAGVNRPQRLDDMTEEQLLRTLGPKIDGLRNVLSAVDEQHLRLLVGFGSIIGRMGMMANGDYALANDWLTAEVEETGARLPGCRCLSLEWSVWAGVGMGDTLGLIDLLAARGVMPISVDEGTALLRRLLDGASRPVGIVATGRFGEPRTLAFQQADLPLDRFLEWPQVHVPGVELVTDAVLDTATDPYLADHTLNGVPVLPAVVGLEAMAQAAALLSPPSSGSGHFCDVELVRPITVPADGKRTVRVAALRDAVDGRVMVVVRSDETGFAAEHFRATWLPDPPDVPELVTSDADPVPLDVDRHLYGELLFHGERFRRVRAFRELQAHRSTVEILAEAEPRWFSQYLPQRLRLGDPGARDAFIHAQQACVPHLRFLPVAVEALSVLAAPRGAVTASAVERSFDGETMVVDLTVRDGNGRVCESWRGLAMRAIEPMPARTEWPPALLVPYLERRAGTALALEATSSTTVALSRLLGHPVELVHRSDGKPEIAAAPDTDVSVSHCDGHTLVVTGAGCDMEVVAGRDRATWAGMLGTGPMALADRLAAEAAAPIDAFDVAATRVWAAVEAARKAGRLLEPLTLDGVDADGWVSLRAGSRRVLTYATALTGHPKCRVVAIVLHSAAGVEA